MKDCKSFYTAFFRFAGPVQGEKVLKCFPGEKRFKPELLYNCSTIAMLLLLFGGFWLGMHSFLGFVRLSSRLDREARLPLLSAEDYDRAVLNRTGQARRTVVDQEK